MGGVVSETSKRTKVSHKEATGYKSDTVALNAIEPVHDTACATLSKSSVDLNCSSDIVFKDLSSNSSNLDSALLSSDFKSDELCKNSVNISADALPTEEHFVNLVVRRNFLYDLNVKSPSYSSSKGDILPEKRESLGTSVNKNGEFPLIHSNQSVKFNQISQSNQSSFSQSNPSSYPEEIILSKTTKSSFELPDVDGKGEKEAKGIKVCVNNLINSTFYPKCFDITFPDTKNLIISLMSSKETFVSNVYFDDEFILLNYLSFDIKNELNVFAHAKNWLINSTGPCMLTFLFLVYPFL